MEVSDSPSFDSPALIPVAVQSENKTFSRKINMGTGTKALYFKFRGTGAVDFIAFELK